MRLCLTTGSNNYHRAQKVPDAGGLGSRGEDAGTATALPNLYILNDESFFIGANDAKRRL